MWALRTILLSTLYVSTYMFSVAAADSVKQKQKNRVAVDTSRLLTINRILIVGNKVTRDFIIQRELSVKSGDTIRLQSLSAALEKDKIKLLNTRLFVSVNLRTLDYENGVVDILVQLTERWYTFPIPIFELADRNFNEWWQNYNHDFRRVNYGLRLYQYNFRGRNETVLLTAKFGFTQNFKLTYRLPYLDKKRKQGLVFDLNYDERNNIAYKTLDNKLEFVKTENKLRTTRTAGITYTYRNSFYHFHGLSYDYTTYTISDSLAKLNPDYLGGFLNRKQVFSTISYNYIYENRDFIGYPLQGKYLTLTLRQQGLFKKDDLSRTDLIINYSNYWSLGKKYYLSNQSNIYASLQDEVPYVNYAALGYSRQFVRGYEIYLIEGPQYAYNKTTFKKQIFYKNFYAGGRLEQFQEIPLTIYLKTYADFGYVWNYPGYTNGALLTDKLLTGIGFGFDFVSSHDAVMRLEYSFNGEGENGFFFHLRKEF